MHYKSIYSKRFIPNEPTELGLILQSIRKIYLLMGTSDIGGFSTLVHITITGDFKIEKYYPPNF